MNIYLKEPRVDKMTVRFTVRGLMGGETTQGNSAIVS